MAKLFKAVFAIYLKAEKYLIFNNKIQMSFIKFSRIRFDNNRRQRFFHSRFRQRRVGRSLQRVRPLRPLLHRRHHRLSRVDRLRLHLIQNVSHKIRHSFFVTLFSSHFFRHTFFRRFSSNSANKSIGISFLLKK